MIFSNLVIPALLMGFIMPYILMLFIGNRAFKSPFGSLCASASVGYTYFTQQANPTIPVIILIMVVASLLGLAGFMIGTKTAYKHN